jgi:hypothetical protein
MDVDRSYRAPEDIRVAAILVPGPGVWTFLEKILVLGATGAY